MSQITYNNEFMLVVNNKELDYDNIYQMYNACTGLDVDIKYKDFISKLEQIKNELDIKKIYTIYDKCAYSLLEEYLHDNEDRFFKFDISYMNDNGNNYRYDLDDIFKNIYPNVSNFDQFKTPHLYLTDCEVMQAIYQNTNIRLFKLNSNCDKKLKKIFNKYFDKIVITKHFIEIYL